MTKRISLLMIVVSLLYACNIKKSANEPELILETGNPYVLKINNFEWQAQDGKVIGDFSTLDRKVVEAIESKVGICEVYLKHNPAFDKSDNAYDHVGWIYLVKDKPKDWQAFHNLGGIRTMIEKHLNTSFETIGDTTLIEPVTPDTIGLTSNNGSTAASSLVQSYTQKYIFSITDLYPIDEDREGLDSYRFNVNGTIIGANFSEGAMKIRSEDGEEWDVQFSPLRASSAVASNLRLAVKPGNRIRSVCARAGASTVDLVSATITANNN